jgi:glycosyltransferase involved in cell wall biosynthesis
MTPHSHDTIPATDRPLFSVIVPFLNEEGWLPKCLAALRAQTIDPGLVEWIMIDNGSTDRSAEIVRAEPRATLLAEPRRDPYIARNRGILAARGRHLAFLDADCLAEPDWLEAMQRQLTESDAAILLGYLAYPSPRSLALQIHEDYEDAKLRQVLESVASSRPYRRRCSLPAKFGVSMSRSPPGAKRAPCFSSSHGQSINRCRKPNEQTRSYCLAGDHVMKSH